MTSAILIVMDDCGLDYIQTYISSKSNWNKHYARTPNIDALANNGVRFWNGASMPWCSATRVGIHTGLYNWRTGVGSLIKGGGTSGFMQPDKYPYLPAAIQGSARAPVQTAHFGKWHMAESGRTGSPAQFGYDHYQGHEHNVDDSSAGRGDDHYASWQYNNNGALSTETTYNTAKTGADAVSWIAARVSAGDQYFAHVAFQAPHSPFHKAPAGEHTFDTDVSGLSSITEYFNGSPTTSSLYWATTDETGGTATSDAGQIPFTADFLSMIEALDKQVGAILTAAGIDVDAHKWNDTTVMVIGDNGTPGSWVKSPFTDGTYYKTTVYRYGCNVPWIVAGPEEVVWMPGDGTAPRDTYELVQVQDLYPTLVEIFGGKVSQVTSGIVDGESFLDVLRVDGGKSGREFQLCEVFPDSLTESIPSSGGGDVNATRTTDRSVRNARYNYISKNDGETIEIYDWADDEFEAVNLFGKTGGIKNHLQVAALSDKLAEVEDAIAQLAKGHHVKVSPKL